MLSSKHGRELDKILRAGKKVARRMKEEKHPDIVLHVGLHKTATTFLQEEVFPKLDETKVNFINLTGQTNADTVLGISLDCNRINLISREGFSGFPYEIEKDYPSMTATMRERIAVNLYKMFPHARVIIGVRDKEDWLHSLFRQHAKMKPNLASFKEFRKRFDDRYLDFEGYISLLEVLFKDVYVYKFETLKEDYQEFTDGICKFIGVDTPDDVENVVYNKGWSKGQQQLVTAAYSIFRKGYMVFRHMMELANREKK